MANEASFTGISIEFENDSVPLNLPLAVSGMAFEFSSEERADDYSAFSGLAIEFEDVDVSGEITIDLAYAAKKQIKAREKHISKTYSDHMFSVMGCDGRISGLEAVGFSIGAYDAVTLGPGKIIQSGVLADIESDTVLMDTTAFTEPYYVCANITNEIDNFNVGINLFQDSTSGTVLAEKADGIWASSNKVGVGSLWEDLISHYNNDLIHSNEDLEAGLDSTSHADALNPYATQMDAGIYDSTNMHYLYSLLLTSIDSMSDRPYSNYGNMAFDSISDGYSLIPYGRSGTFIDVAESGLVGSLGCFSNDSTSSIYTGIIGVTSSIEDHVLIATKILSVESAARSKFSVMTNGSNYQLSNIRSGILTDASALTPNPSSGMYELQLKIDVPEVIGSDFWTAQQDCLDDVSFHGCNALNGRIYLTGGSDNSGLVSNVQEYSSESNTYSYNVMDIDIVSPGTCLSPDGSSIIVVGGENTVGTQLDSIMAINPSTKVVQYQTSAHTGAGSTSVTIGNNIYFGTGYDAGSFSDTWNKFNPASLSVASMGSYPTACAGVDSVMPACSSGKSYHLGGNTSAGTVGTIYRFNPSNNTFSLEVIDGSSNVSQSYSNSSVGNGVNNIFTSGGATGNMLSETFSYSSYEYDVNSSSFVSRINANITAGHVGMAMRNDGIVYASGGRSGNVSPNLSLNSTYAYTKPGYFLAGWGIEWR